MGPTLNAEKPKRRTNKNETTDDKTTPRATKTTENQRRAQKTKPPHQKQHPSRPKLKKRQPLREPCRPRADFRRLIPNPILSQKAKFSRTHQTHGGVSTPAPPALGAHGESVSDQALPGRVSRKSGRAGAGSIRPGAEAPRPQKAQLRRFRRGAWNFANDATARRGCARSRYLRFG